MTPNSPIQTWRARKKYGLSLPETVVEQQFSPLTPKRDVTKLQAIQENGGLETKKPPRIRNNAKK